MGSDKWHPMHNSRRRPGSFRWPLRSSKRATEGNFGLNFFSGCRPVGHQTGMVRIYPPGRYGNIPFLKTGHHADFVSPGNQPKNTPGTIEGWIGQCEPASPLIDASRSDVSVRHLKYWVSRDQGGRVPIWT